MLAGHGDARAIGVRLNVNQRAALAQHHLGVIAGWRLFNDNRFAFSEQAGQ